MKNIAIKFLTLVAAGISIFAVQSCKKNATTESHGAKIDVNVTIDGVEQAEKQKAASRTMASKTTFASGDKLGLWVAPYSNSEGATPTPTALRAIGNYVDNALYTHDGTNFITSAGVYYPNAVALVDLYAVSPYDAKMSASTGNNMTDPKVFAFSIKTDQSTAAGIDVIASDIMTAKTEKAKQGSAATLAFTHRMSKAVVAFEIAAGATYKGQAITAVEKVELCGVQLASTLDVTSSATAPTITGDLVSNPKHNILAYKAIGPAAGTIAGQYNYEAIVMPGTKIVAGASIARVILTVDNKPVVFDCKTTTEYTYVASQQTSISITIEDQTAITLPSSSVTITGWGTPVTPGVSTVKPAKMIFTTAGNQTTAATVKYVDLTIDGATYRADVVVSTNKFECTYRMPGNRFPDKLTEVKFYAADGTTVVSATLSPAIITTTPATIKGNPFDTNNYIEVIATATFQ